MANRMIRDTTKSDKINKLSDFEECFFNRLMQKADDYGAYYGSAKLLNAYLFPLKDHITDGAVMQALKACEAAGLIMLYSVDSKAYSFIFEFGQRLRSKYSKFPLPPQSAAIGGEERPEVEHRSRSKNYEVEEEKGSRARNDSSRKIPFCESEFFDIDKFRADLISSGPPYSEVDLDYYYNCAKLGSESKGYKYINWMSAVKKWILSDQNNRAKKSNQNNSNSINDRYHKVESQLRGG